MVRELHTTGKWHIEALTEVWISGAAHCTHEKLASLSVGPLTCFLNFIILSSKGKNSSLVYRWKSLDSKEVCIFEIGSILPACSQTWWKKIQAIVFPRQNQASYL
jgi:hypothetical protein